MRNATRLKCSILLSIASQLSHMSHRAVGAGARRALITDGCRRQGGDDSSLHPMSFSERRPNDGVKVAIFLVRHSICPTTDIALGHKRSKLFAALAPLIACYIAQRAYVVSIIGQVTGRR